ncbi:MAG: hypothetical protein GEU78_14600 [Actinobacteria bacterium]|nr:hypothetical protein [Actinomycetota bacterium]
MSDVTETTGTELVGQVEVAMQPLQLSLQADGADLAVAGVDGQTAHVRLILGPETCMECIVPKQVMEGILTTAITKGVPQVTAVELEDPRA